MSEETKKPETPVAPTPPANGADQQAYNPFLGPVNDKSYSNPQHSFNPQQLQQDIPEPTFVPPPIDGKKFENPFEEEFKKQAYDEAKKQQEQKQVPVNPALTDLPEDEKEEAAAHMTQAVLAGYEMLNHHANEFLKISDRKVYKMVANGELNMNAEVPYEYDKTMPVGEFIRAYNKEAEGTFYVSDDFRSKVEPIMTRVFKKRGVGLSDEQLLLTLFGKDMWIKFNIGRQMRGTLNEILRLAKEQSGSYERPRPHRQPQREPDPVFHQPPPQPQQQAQPAQQQYQPSPGSPLATQAQYFDANMPANVSNAAPIIPMNPVAPTVQQDVPPVTDPVPEVLTEAKRRGRRTQEKSDKLDDVLLETKRKPRQRSRHRDKGNKPS